MDVTENADELWPVFAGDESLEGDHPETAAFLYILKTHTTETFNHGMSRTDSFSDLLITKKYYHSVKDGWSDEAQFGAEAAIEYLEQND